MIIRLHPRYAFYNQQGVVLENLCIMMGQTNILVINAKIIPIKMLTLVTILFFSIINCLALSFMSLCKECSSYKVCTECDAGKILRNDLTGCVSSCNEDTSSALTGAT